MREARGPRADRAGARLPGYGGAGAGGSLLIQARGSLSFEQGSRLDVQGGRANLEPPRPPGGAQPLYRGNLKDAVAGDRRVRGGLGGGGAWGRVRIEAPAGSNLLKTGFNESLTSSRFFPEAVLSVGCSGTFPLGLAPGGAAFTHLLAPGNPVMRPAGGEGLGGFGGLLLWKGTSPSLDVHGLLEPLRGEVEDPRDLRDLESVQFSVYLLSDRVSGEAPRVRAMVLPYRLGEPTAR